jgi:hypothetical protein
MAYITYEIEKKESEKFVKAMARARPISVSICSPFAGVSRFESGRFFRICGSYNLSMSKPPTLNYDGKGDILSCVLARLHSLVGAKPTQARGKGGECPQSLPCTLSIHNSFSYHHPAQ